MFGFRDIALLAAGLFLGFTFATMVLYPQIANRYRVGENAGFIEGQQRVMGFLAKEFPAAENSADLLPLASLSVKSRSIEMFEKNGVRTLRVR